MSDRVAVGAADYREVLEGNLTDNARTYPLAPFLEGDALDRYLKFKRRYPHLRTPDLPPAFEMTDYCSNLVAGHGSRVARKAVAQGQLAELAFFSGVTRKEVSFGMVEQFARLLSHLDRDGYMSVLLGQTNSGKTNFATLNAALYLRTTPDAHLVSNLRVSWGVENLDARTHYAETTKEVLSIVDDVPESITILDEMSTSANAATDNYDVVDSLYPVITDKSKLSTRLVVIGHREDLGDLAPSVHEHARHIVVTERVEQELEDDEFAAAFYRDADALEDSSAEFRVPDVPPVSANYDPDQKQDFEL
ncbi:hypothetical protein BRD16_01685 [Halobacteriales archaeon SW_6_65_46]|nr:MAG: hypothetical protein BRD16_01685 [Halobacteriales archaeon SW_6_65_46]